VLLLHVGNSGGVSKGTFLNQHPRRLFAKISEGLDMELSLAGKTALVTGGSRGIGKAVATVFASAGAKVMISSRKPDALAEAVATMEGEVDFYAANAGNPNDAERCVARTIERFGSLDILVNNAATNPYMGALIDVDVSRADKTVQVNQMGVLWWSQWAWRSWMSRHGGTILNIASVGGMSVEPGLGIYNVTKAAVIQLTKQLAYELAPFVRVNAIAPGLVKTQFARALWENAEDTIAERLPLRRLGEVDDVAKAALFLVSEAASWITGTVLVVDGGTLTMPSGGITA